MDGKHKIETTWRCLHDDPLPEVDASMSNFDHVVEAGLTEAISDGQHMADYAAWEFHALVYLGGGEGIYVADIHRFHLHVDFQEATTLEDLMNKTSDKWGWD